MRQYVSCNLEEINIIQNLYVVLSVYQDFFNRQNQTKPIINLGVVCVDQNQSKPNENGEQQARCVCVNQNRGKVEAQ